MTPGSRDLVVLIADKNIEGALRGLLSRPRALGLREISCDLYVHPERDPGCRLRAHHFLKPFAHRYAHALVVFDREGSGRDEAERTALERQVEGLLSSSGWVLTPLPGADLWETASRQVTTRNWEMYDIVHAVLPTKLSLEEFYEEYSGLWRHVLDVRYRHRGKLRTYVGLGVALATRKVTLGAVRKGMNIAKVFSKPEIFLEAHAE